MKNFVKLFPTIDKFTYLNTPGIGLISKNVRDFKHRYNEGYFLEASSHVFPAMGTTHEIRERIAHFLHGDPAQVTLVSCFSVGFNALLEGLPQQSSILLLKDDYPSINWAVEARNFSVDYATIDAHLEDNIEQAFERKQPDVFIFSIVQFINGIKVNLDVIRELKEKYPQTLFIGDGTQYFGTENFNFSTSGLDAVGASGYKWLNAGMGNGFFLFKEEMKNHIDPKYLGFGSKMGKYKSEGDTLIGKFEGNHLDFASIGSLKIALQDQEKIGVDFIENKIKQLADQAKQTFTSLGILEKTVANRAEHSNIFNLQIDETAIEKLIQNDIVGVPRGSGFRIGFHYYNDEKDIEKVADILTFA